MRLMVQLLNSLGKVSRRQVERGSFHWSSISVCWRLIVSRFGVLDLLEYLLSHHLIYESLLFLSIFSCLSNFPDLHLSLVIVDNFYDIIIPHLSRVICWQRIYAIITSEVLQLVLLSGSELFLQLPRQHIDFFLQRLLL